MFQVIVGEDPDDPATAAARGRPRRELRACAQRDGLTGARIGVLRQAYERTRRPTDGVDDTTIRVPAYSSRRSQDLKRAGAGIVDPATVDGLDAIRRAAGRPVHGASSADIKRYFASHGDRVAGEDGGRDLQVGSLPSDRAASARAGGAGCRERTGDAGVPGARRSTASRFARPCCKTMDSLKLDAFVYPTWSNPPRLIGDLNTPHGDNSQFFSPTTGFPAIRCRWATRAADAACGHHLLRPRVERRRR